MLQSDLACRQGRAIHDVQAIVSRGVNHISHNVNGQSALKWQRDVCYDLGRLGIYHAQPVLMGDVHAMCDRIRRDAAQSIPVYDGDRLSACQVNPVHAAIASAENKSRIGLCVNGQGKWQLADQDALLFAARACVNHCKVIRLAIDDI